MSKRNAYYFYMLEYKANHKQNGKELSMSAASLAASDSWKKMTPEEKFKYKKMAEEAVNEPRTHRKPKTRSCCKPKSKAVLLQEQKKRNEALKMRDQVMDWLLSSLSVTEIENINFIIIRMNMFYENIPAEVGLVRFSLKQGVMQVMNELIYVKNLPLGAAFAAESLSEKTHGLPLPPRARGYGDYGFVLGKIECFCAGSMIFCHPDDMEDVKNGLKYLRNTSDDDETFIISDFVELLRQLVEYLSKTSQTESITYQQVMTRVLKDPFDSCVKGCDIHDDLDRNKFCSESIVKRLAYECIQTCSKYLKIQMIPGVHGPERVLSC